jgi:hypothetical protein
MSKEAKQIEAPKEHKVATKTAYCMIQGANFMQYRLLKLTFEDGVLVAQEDDGNPDLKPVVLGRLLKRMVKV